MSGCVHVCMYVCMCVLEGGQEGGRVLCMGMREGRESRVALLPEI